MFYASILCLFISFYFQYGLCDMITGTGYFLSPLIQRLFLKEFVSLTLTFFGSVTCSFSLLFKFLYVCSVSSLLFLKK